MDTCPRVFHPNFSLSRHDNISLVKCINSTDITSEQLSSSLPSIVRPLTLPHNLLMYDVCRYYDNVLALIFWCQLYVVRAVTLKEFILSIVAIYIYACILVQSKCVAYYIRYHNDGCYQ